MWRCETCRPASNRNRPFSINFFVFQNESGYIFSCNMIQYTLNIYNFLLCCCVVCHKAMLYEHSWDIFCILGRSSFLWFWLNLGELPLYIDLHNVSVRNLGFCPFLLCLVFQANFLFGPLINLDRPIVDFLVLSILCCIT